MYFVSDNLKKQEKNPKRNRNSSIATILKDYVRKAQYSMGQSLYTSTLTAIIKEKKNEDLCSIIKKKLFRNRASDVHLEFPCAVCK